MISEDINLKNNENKNIELSEEFFEETKIEGRNPVLEAFRSGKTVDKLFERNVWIRCQKHIHIRA